MTRQCNGACPLPCQVAHIFENSISKLESAFPPRRLKCKQNKNDVKGWETGGQMKLRQFYVVLSIVPSGGGVS